MDNLQKTSRLVLHILETDKQTRNSDSLLYLRVLEHAATHNGCDLHSMSVHHFLMYKNDYPFLPWFETVRRARQKIQHNFPHLAACGRVGAMREVNEQEFRAYAKKVLP